MSFGTSVGDILAVGTLAWNTYRNCKGATKEFDEASRECMALHVCLKELQEEAQNTNSILNRKGADSKRDLLTIVSSCETTLKELDALVKKYRSLGTVDKNKWDIFRFGNVQLGDIRSKLTVHSSTINLVIASYNTGALSRIEQKLDDLAKDLKSGRREGSILSRYDDGDENVWKSLRRELVEEGISNADIGLFKEEIKAYIKHLTEQGDLDIEMDPEFSDTSSEDTITFDSESPRDATHEQLQYKMPYVEDEYKEPVNSRDHLRHPSSSTSDTMAYRRNFADDGEDFDKESICYVCQGTDKTCDCLLREARSRILRNYQLPADIKNHKDEYVEKSRKCRSRDEGPLLLEYKPLPLEDLSPCGWQGILPAGWSVRFEVNRRSPYSQRYPKPTFHDEFYHKTEERYKRRRKFGSPPTPERYPDDPLPLGWSRSESNTGRIFYWHHDSGLECYQHPAHNARIFFDNGRTHVPRDPSRFVTVKNASLAELRNARGFGLRWHAGLVEWHEATWVPVIKSLDPYGPEKWVLDDPNVSCQVSSWAMKPKASNAARPLQKQNPSEVPIPIPVRPIPKKDPPAVPVVPRRDSPATFPLPTKLEVPKSQPQEPKITSTTDERSKRKARSSKITSHRRDKEGDSAHRQARTAASSKDEDEEGGAERVQCASQ